MEKILKIDDLSIHYLADGPQETEFPHLPIVLLHGGGTDTAELSWKFTFPYLAERYQVFAPDWPGYGMSDPLPGIFTVRALIELTGRLLDAWGIERAILVGISMGGAAALGYALDHPNRVAGVVPVDAYGLQVKAPFHSLSYLLVQWESAMMASWNTMRRSRLLTRWIMSYIFANQKAVSGELVEEVYQLIQRDSAGKAFYSFQRDEMLPHGLRTNYLDRIGRLTVPALFVQGDRDRLVPPDASRRAAALAPNARLAVISPAGHWPPREQPESFNRALLDFLTNRKYFR